MVWVNIDILLRIPPLQSVSCIAYITNRNRLTCVLGPYQAVVAYKGTIVPDKIEIGSNDKDFVICQSQGVYRLGQRRVQSI